MAMLIKGLFLTAVLWPAYLSAQKPVITRVVNAASYSTTDGAVGAIGTILGRNLATSTESATTVPLPTTLAGTTVSFSGLAVPLLYVSPNQINFQVPSPPGNEPPGPSTARGIVVTTAAGDSVPYSATVSGYQLGIFTLDASGCGRGAVLNVAADSGVSLNSRENSVSPGQYISIFATGLGLVYPMPPDGYASPLDIITNGFGGGGLFDFSPSGVSLPGKSVDAVWEGRAPGLVGVDQFNVPVPLGVRDGCSVPLRIGADSVSQPVTIAVRKGGGPCVDPPEAGYGKITWERTVSTSATHETSEMDTLTFSLQAAPGKQAPPVEAFSKGPLPMSQVIFGPTCPIPGYRSLDAGVVRVQSLGLSPAPAVLEAITEGQISGLKQYRAVLPAGAIRPGAFTVSASGGSDVGGFESSIGIGSGIQIGTDLAGILLPCNQNVTVHWTGGEPDSWITITELHHLEPLDTYRQWRARASDGAITIDPYPFAPKSCGGKYEIELVVEVTPEPQHTPSFSAPGLSLGGQHTWKYVYRFPAYRGI